MPNAILTWTHALEKMGMQRVDAERAAAELLEAMNTTAATKSDLIALKFELYRGMLAIGGTLCALLFAALHIWPPHL